MLMFACRDPWAARHRWAFSHSGPRQAFRLCGSVPGCPNPSTDCQSLVCQAAFSGSSGCTGAPRLRLTAVSRQCVCPRAPSADWQLTIHTASAGRHLQPCFCDLSAVSQHRRVTGPGVTRPRQSSTVRCREDRSCLSNMSRMMPGNHATLAHCPRFR